MIKLLFYSWGANNEKTLQKNLIELGYELTVICQNCVNYTRDVILAQKLIGIINENHIDGVISLNYFPIISMVCDVANVKYYSWVFDCPHFTLLAKTVGLSCNRIGVFDKHMAEDLQARGVNTVFHLPLAASFDTFSMAILKNRINLATDGDYKYDVSFIGSLYTGEYNYFDKIYSGTIPPSVSGYLNKNVGKYIVTPSISDIAQKDIEEAAKALEELGLALGEDYSYEPIDILMPAVFEKELTVLERDILLRKIAENKDIRFALYTNSKTDIPNYGTCDYSDLMPCIFNASKINLNITLRSIHSGVPLRVIDIMASGGFVLSNYQPELPQMFVENEEIVLFRDIEEALYKVQYYLEHEEERIKIAALGAKAAKERLGYKQQIEKLIQ